MENKNVKITNRKILSDNWYLLEEIEFDYLTSKGKWQNQKRESYNRGNGACILLFNKEKQTIILTKQFRMPSYINGNSNGMLLEVCAGLLDGDDPKTCIIKEVEEEVGYKITSPKKVFELYSTPGAVTEKIHYFISLYTPSMKVSEGGGLDSENEDIEVLEIPFKKAIEMVKTGEICDTKTVLLIQYAQLHNLLN
ncbi:MAG TPA: NUDIX domain-containing protein [Flavobacteriaceae bacterium]|nr:NUDIX domain-containing protein [Flavobacteriaceae bacterium]